MQQLRSFGTDQILVVNELLALNSLKHLQRRTFWNNNQLFELNRIEMTSHFSLQSRDYFGWINENDKLNEWCWVIYAVWISNYQFYFPIS